ncbi:MAG: CotH kinase family protein [Bacteroidales bacterium]|nr:CotH kinase family protein [Bacteroidales bacterium]
MKVFLSSIIIFFSLAGALQAQRADNYKPLISVKLEKTNLPIVVINTNNQIIDREERIEADMKIYYNGDGNLNYLDTIANPTQKFDYSGKIGLKYRGNSSFNSSDKKPFGFRTQNAKGKKMNASILGIGEDTDWVLLAPFSDRSMIRDVLVYTLSKHNFEYTPQLKYCELILDNTYYGIYIIGSRIRQGENRINLEKPGLEGDALSGGYMVEVDRNDEPNYYTSIFYSINPDGSERNQRTFFQYKYPDYEDMDAKQLFYLHQSINTFEASFTSSYYQDPDNGWRKYADENSFVNFMISTEFSRNTDGYRLSSPLYKYRDSKDGGKFRTALWDFNISLGNCDYADGWNTSSWAYNYNNIGNDQLVPFWWYKMLADQSFMKLLRNNWANYRKSSFSDERIDNVIDSLSLILTVEDAEQRNSAAWPKWGEYIWPNYYVSTSYSDEIDYLKNWISLRLAFLDENWLLKPMIEKGNYMIRNVSSSQYLSVDNSGNPIMTESNSQNSFWRVDYDDDAPNDITISYSNENSALANTAAGVNNVVPQMLDTDKNDERQVWNLQNYTTSFKIVSKADGFLLRHRLREDDNRIVMYNNNDDASDKLWQFIPYTIPSSIENEKEIKPLIYAQSGKIIVLGVSIGAEITIAAPDGKIISVSKTLDVVAQFDISSPGVYIVNIRERNKVSSGKVMVK